MAVACWAVHFTGCGLLTHGVLIFMNVGLLVALPSQLSIIGMLHCNHCVVILRSVVNSQTALGNVTVRRCVASIRCAVPYEEVICHSENRRQLSSTGFVHIVKFNITSMLYS